MASSTSGLTYSPAALDPYQIETTLAKDAYEGPGNPQQQTLLDQYWLERQANKNLYGQEIEANRVLQQQQMANALREKALGLYKDAGTTPGLADVLTQQGLNYGANLSGLSAAADAAARAEQWSKYGSASSGLSTAGMGPEALTTNLGIPGFGVRPDIQIAQMREAGANARAAAHGQKEDSFIAPVGGPDVLDPSTGQVQKTGVKLRYSDTDAQIQAKVDFARRALGLTQLQPSGVPGVPASQSPVGPNAAQPSGRTSLGPAKPSATTAKPAAQAAPTGSGQQQQQLILDNSKSSQDRARAGLRSLPPQLQQQYNRIMPKLGNNVPVTMQNGKLHYVMPDATVGPAVP